MSTNDAYEKELEAQEKKHKKLVKYDVELFVVVLVIILVTTVSNLYLKGEYKLIAGIKPDLAPSIVECNKSILNATETFRKNTTDTIARAAVEKAKQSFDEAIVYYGKSVKKGTDEATILSVVDSAYYSAVHFRSILRAQKGLTEAGVTDIQLQNIENTLATLHLKIDTLVAGIDQYNEAGFLLKLSWLTPYPSRIEYNHAKLPELEPIVALPPEQH